ncbi:cytochrome c oxidase subunit CcoM [Aestuariirhabdus haliotis]|nr:cytochrome c oxidase subunit CcoM [Aestuariirhabdus haliotis]
MFLDEVVLAGLLTVGLMLSFFVGLYYFLRKDMDKHP